MSTSRKDKAATQLLGTRSRHLICPHPKPLQDVRTEGVDEWYVGRVAASGDDDPAYPRRVVARIEGVPFAIEEHLHPGAEIHRIDDRDADVAEMTVDVARRDVEAPAKRDR